MNLYAQSSAVLAWLLGEPGSAAVRHELERADHILASDLTVIECERALLRAVALGEMSQQDAADRRQRLISSALHGHRLHIAEPVVKRAGEPFPGYPIRTLDAIHLASCLVTEGAIGRLDMLSLDRRVREAAQALGLTIRPEA